MEIKNVTPRFKFTLGSQQKTADQPEAWTLTCQLTNDITLVVEIQHDFSEANDQATLVMYSFDLQPGQRYVLLPKDEYEAGRDMAEAYAENPADITAWEDQHCSYAILGGNLAQELMDEAIAKWNALQQIVQMGVKW